MRDSEMMVSLLREMEAEKGGRITIFWHMGMGEEELHRYHNVELLIDAGHAKWTGPQKSIVRITNDGYDFVHAFDANRSFRKKYLELFEKGFPYIRAVDKAMSLFS